MLALEYVVRRPRADIGTRPPLLVLLHGVGGNEHGLFARESQFDPRFLVVSPRAPYVLGHDKHRWFDVEFTASGPVINAIEAEASRQALVQFINDAVMAFGADPRQVYLLGFSQGATLGYSALLSAPQKFRGAVLVAGRVLAEVAPLAAPAQDFEHLTMLIQHGRADPVIPLSRSTAARDLFVDLGVSLGYREYQAGHEISAEMTCEAAEFLHTQLERLSVHAPPSHIG
jgi:phospholipase/carboxylesterase